MKTPFGRDYAYWILFTPKAAKLSLILHSYFLNACTDLIRKRSVIGFWLSKELKVESNLGLLDFEAITLIGRKIDRIKANLSWCLYEHSMQLFQWNLSPAQKTRQKFWKWRDMNLWRLNDERERYPNSRLISIIAVLIFLFGVEAGCIAQR